MKKGLTLLLCCLSCLTALCQTKDIKTIDSSIIAFKGKSYILKVDTSNLYSPSGYVVGKSIDSSIYDESYDLRFFIRYKYPTSLETKQQTLSETYCFLNYGYTKVIITFYSNPKPSESYYFKKDELIHSTKSDLKKRDVEIMLDNLKYWRAEKEYRPNKKIN